MLLTKTPDLKIQPAVSMLLSLLPMAIVMLYAPLWMVPLVVIASAALFFKVTFNLQSALFTFNKQEAFLWVILPLEAALVLLGSLLVRYGRLEVFTRDLCFFIALIICAIWPVIRKKSGQTERRIPYPTLYFAIAGVVTLEQIYVLLRTIL